MILQTQHETRLEYSDHVSEWLAEVRMEPISDPRQSCHSFHLTVSQPTTMFRYQDGFGNRVHHFNLMSPNQQVRMLAASIVETPEAAPDVRTSRASYPLALDNVEPSLLGYLQFGGPVRKSPLLAPVLEKLQPCKAMPLGALLEQTREYLFSHFTYASDVTHVSSPIDDLLSKGQGVCQDFAHLMIAVLRSYGIPTRYVSGYLHRPGKESQSHAWCEAWLPDLGWVGIDPTNNCFAGDHFVRVAVGRDFTDVTPNKGVYRGKGKEAMWVRVETRELDKVPPLSWQEELPPLDVPLTSIRLRERINVWLDETSAQQQ